ncbi:MAG: immunity 26/phosphotriesterase HocA family protein, partial [Muribaculaceae bacterium]|nr:immunity 26/phosphotriesterase HocA family protein [Muribaculaceae bacterium]
SFSEKGIYFSYSQDHIQISNYTTQTTFFEENNDSENTIEEWLRKWVEESTEKDLEDIQRIKVAKRLHQKYAEGDFFTFKVGRRKWGFGRIVLDVAKRRRSDEFCEANPGLKHLMGQTLMIMVYRHLSDSPETDLDNLHTYGTLPVQAIMDNHFYYGEYTIIGNRPVRPEEWEPVISLDRTYDHPDDWDIRTYLDRKEETSGTAYLQYGLICAHTDVENMREFLIPGAQGDGPIYKNGAVGFNIDHYEDLERIISEGINNDTLLLSNENRKDLRKKENYEVKSGIFRILGLDPDASYADNLRIFASRDT